MGGLFAATGQGDVVPTVMNGLAYLAHPECDTSGLGVLAEHRIERRRVGGPLNSLADLLVEAPISATTVIGHTEHTAHRSPSRRNAQPHASSRVAVAQVGTIENHAALRLELEAEGVHFRSDVEGEVIVWLLDRQLAKGTLPITALHRVLQRLRGSFGIAFICPRFNDRVYAAHRGSSLAVGKSRPTAMIASSTPALRQCSEEWMTLGDGQLAELRPGRARVFNAALEPCVPSWNPRPPAVPSGLEPMTTMTGSTFEEIARQPDLVAGLLDSLAQDLESGDAERWCGPLSGADRILAIGSGDSYRAAEIGRVWLEQIANIPVELERSSELATRSAVFREGLVPLVVCGSESAEEDQSAFRHLRRRSLKSVAVVHGSTRDIAAQADFVLGQANLFGASSRASFLAQLCVLAAAAIAAGRLRNTASADERSLRSLFSVPHAMRAALGAEESCAKLGSRLAKVGGGLLVGREMSRPLAEIGARRLSALAGLTALGLAGGELEYLPLQRLDKGTPVMILVPDGGSAEQALTDAQRLASLGGEPWLIGDAATTELAMRRQFRCIAVEPSDPRWAVFTLLGPIELIAAYAASGRGVLPIGPEGTSQRAPRT